jgi:hypothetical protein
MNLDHWTHKLRLAAFVQLMVNSKGVFEGEHARCQHSLSTLWSKHWPTRVHQPMFITGEFDLLGLGDDVSDNAVLLPGSLALGKKNVVLGPNTVCPRDRCLLESCI